MAEEKSSGGLSFGSNGLVWLLLVAAGTAFLNLEAPFQDARPTVTAPALHGKAPPQDIDARLWQDPFGAINKARAAASERGGRADGRDPRALRFDADARLKRALIVTVPGAPFSEQTEARRRYRYAVLAGLSASGFTPVDATHIGYFVDPIEEHPPADLAAGIRELKTPTTVSLGGKPPLAAGAGGGERLRWVPFESFRDAEGTTGLMVLWVDEDSLGDRPLEALDRMMCETLRSLPEGTTSKVIGPGDGDTVAQMAREAAVRQDKAASLRCAAAPREFYAYGVTVDDAVVLGHAGFTASDRVASLHEHFTAMPAKLDYYRTVTRDRTLIDALLRELRKRGIDSADQLAVITEMDTDYSRSFADELARKIEAAGFGTMRRYKYLRGLDGQLPGNTGADKGRSTKSEDKAKEGEKEDPIAAFRSKPSERADGESQFDYLRRLARTIVRDAEHPGARKPIKAIGIIGSDVYDKLLILRALRPEFREAIFFTTGLDARLLDPGEHRWARNLLVASGFGLELDASMQPGIAPFRDDYQTAVFLSTRLALAAAPPDLRPLRQLLNRPLLFQVGRSRATTLPVADEATPDCTVKPLDGRCLQRLDPPFQEIGFYAAVVAVLLTAAGLFGIGLVVRIARGYVALSGEFDTARGMGRLNLLHASLWAAVALIAAAMFWAQWPAIAHWLTEDGEPLLLFEGVSLWPGIALRFLAAMFGLYLIFHTLFRLDRNIDEISHRLNIGVERRKILREHKWRLVEAFSLRLLPEDRGSGVVQIQEFWSVYVTQGRTRSRVLRVCLCLVGMTGVFFALGAVFGFPENPGRGPLTRGLYQITTLLEVYVTQFLVFLVADASLFACRFVRELRRYPSVWPDTNTVAERLAMNAELIKDWIDIAFVAMRTECIIGLVYWPFLLLALLVVGRSGLIFTGFALNPTLMLAQGISIAVMVGCVLWLRWEAEEARETARDALAERLIAAKGSAAAEGPRNASQLELLLKRIETIRQGAFTPISHQPVIRALLLPLGGYGGTALLQYLT